TPGRVYVAIGDRRYDVGAVGHHQRQQELLHVNGRSDVDVERGPDDRDYEQDVNDDFVSEGDPDVVVQAGGADAFLYVRVTPADADELDVEPDAEKDKVGRCGEVGVSVDLEQVRVPRLGAVPVHGGVREDVEHGRDHRQDEVDARVEPGVRLLQAGGPADGHVPEERDVDGDHRVQPLQARDGDDRPGEIAPGLVDEPHCQGERDEDVDDDRRGARADGRLLRQRPPVKQQHDVQDRHVQHERRARSDEPGQTVENERRHWPRRYAWRGESRF
ncbi:MAG: hypothetical protein BJ554DRAFT_7000, partial [Olpidium bornovanus]